LRRLAAIVAVDVVGYSRLMAADEDGTLEAWLELRRLIDPAFQAGGGRVVKSTGDGVLVESPSVIEAVRAAIRSQELTAEWNLGRDPERALLLRIGVNVGDVIVGDDGDIFGEGVNVAARLEGLAEPGGICVSDAVHAQVRGRVEAAWVDRGEQWVKNLPAPIRVWAVAADGSAGAGLDVGVSGLERAELVGRGGNASVYRAYQPSMDRWVAVKVLDGSDEVTRRRFDRERQTMGRLSQHPGIVSVYQSGFTPLGHPFLVMPFFEAGSLQDRLDRGGPIGWEEAVGLVSAVAEAVEYAHREGVVHRDLKPGNIMLDREGRPLVADFGIARLTGASYTVTEHAALTPAFSPPEALDGAQPSPSGDVYGLAATLVALVTGMPPFVTGTPDTDTLLALSRRIAEGPPPDLRPWGVPEEVARAVERAMAKSPADRPASANEFAAQLAGDRPVPGATTITVSPPRVPAAAERDDEAPSEAHAGRRRPMALLIGGAVVVAVGAFALFSGGRPDTTGTTTAADGAVTTSPADGVDTTDPAALDPTTGVAWRFEVPGRVGPVAADQSHAYLALSDGTIVVVDASTGGAVVEPRPAGGQVVDLAALNRGYVWTVTGSKLVRAWDVADDRELWRALPSVDALGVASVVVEGERVLVGVGFGVSSLDAVSGDEWWANPTVGRGPIDLLAADGDLVAAGDGRSVFGVDAGTGNPVWEAGPPTVSRPPVWVGVRQVEIDTGSGRGFERFVLTVTAGQELLVFDGDTGDLLWKTAVSGLPAVTDDRVFVAGVDGELQAWDLREGSPVWSRPELVVVQTPLAVDGRLYVVLDGDPALVSVNPRSGSSQGSTPVDAVPTRPPIWASSLVLLVTESADGSVVAAYPPPG
jgi:class 3 adenylate cyclase/outer membrane protein assembly factor BamB